MKRLLAALLLANLLLAGYVWLKETRPPAPREVITELNPDKLKLVAQPVSAAPASPAAPLACLEWSGIQAADAQRAEAALAGLDLGERVSARRVEEAKRYWVFIPPQENSTAAQQTLAQLRDSGVTDAYAMPDHSVSLGVYAAEEPAERYRAQLEGKGVKDVRVAPRNPVLKEMVFTVREAGAATVEKLNELAAQFPGSALKPCPA